MFVGKCAAGVIALGLLAAPAAAQEWSGPYVGSFAGYAVQGGDDDERIDFDKNLDGNFNDTVTTTAGANAFSPGFCDGRAPGASRGSGCDDDEGGPDFGVRLGYDRQYGNWVVGGLVEAAAVDVQDNVTAFSTTPASYTLTRDLNALAALRGRVGYGMGANLVYGTAGVAAGSMDMNNTTTNAANSFIARNDDEVVYGFQAGLGGERRVNERVAVGLEYLFTSLQDEDFRVRVAGPAPATNPFILTNPSGTDFRRSDDRFDLHSLRATLSYRF